MIDRCIFGIICEGWVFEWTCHRRVSTWHSLHEKQLGYWTGKKLSSAIVALRCESPSISLVSLRFFSIAGYGFPQKQESSNRSGWISTHIPNPIRHLLENVVHGSPFDEPKCHLRIKEFGCPPRVVNQPSARGGADWDLNQHVVLNDEPSCRFPWTPPPKA